MAVAIERYLKDFSQPEPFVVAPDLSVAPQTSPDPLDLMGAMPEQPLAAEIPMVPDVDVEAERAEAYQQAVQETTQALTEAHQAELESERSRHLEEINELRTQSEQDLSTTLAERFDQLSADLTERIGEQVARIVAPFMEQALSAQMVEQLATAITQTLSDEEGMRISISGSPSMFEALKEAVGERASQLDFTETEAFDVTVKLDETVLSTRLSEWADTLREVLS